MLAGSGTPVRSASRLRCRMLSSSFQRRKFSDGHSPTGSSSSGRRPQAVDLLKSDWVKLRQVCGAVLSPRSWPRASLHNHQCIRRANCICRALVTTVVMVPAPGEPLQFNPAGVGTVHSKVALGKPKFGWFSTLKNSDRNCIPSLSWIGKSLATPRSQVNRPGPVKMLRPALPKLPSGGATKHAGSNHSWMLCLSEDRLPLQIRLGRVKNPLVGPRPDRKTENGGPDCAVRMLVNCHRPATFSASAPEFVINLRPRPKGSS